MVYMPYNIYKGDYMTEFKLIVYEKENGKVPVEQFLGSVNPKMRAKIFGLLGILQEKGICLENLTVNIWMTEYLNCVVNSGVILPGSYIFSIMREK